VVLAGVREQEPAVALELAVLEQAVLELARVAAGRVPVESLTRSEVVRERRAHAA